MALLSAQGLTVTIAGRRICHGLDLNILPGDRWVILGPNGSGKTTLLHTLAGLRPAQGGDILLQGKRLHTLHPHQRAKLVGTLLQHDNDPFPSTVLETALIGRHPYIKRWRWENGDDMIKARMALAMMDLEEFENHAVATLSGGERRRLAIATMLTQDPPLLLLDEPTNHLDLSHQINALELLTRLVSQGTRALAMVLHDISAAVRYCDHALLLFGDGVTLAGAVSDVVTEQNLARLYGHAIRRLTGPDGDVWTPAFNVDR